MVICYSMDLTAIINKVFARHLHMRVQKYQNLTNQTSFKLIIY